MLVAMAVLLIVMVLLYSIIQQTGTIWKQTRGKIDQMQEAQAALDSMTSRLSQATLNTYWDYYDANGIRVPPGTPNQVPAKYQRFSELHFKSGSAGDLGIANAVPGKPAVSQGIFFQAPLGYTTRAENSNLSGLLSAGGFFIQFNSDKDFRPPFIQTPERWRYRLMEAISPAEQLSIYSQYAPTATPNDGWIKDVILTGARPLAENIVALIVTPKLPASDSPGQLLCPNYRYDSRDSLSSGGLWFHQLPPLIDLTLVAIDESSANRIAKGNTPPLTLPAFTDATKYADDLQQLEKSLKELGIKYRIFTATVAMRNAKWSHFGWKSSP